MSSRAHNSAAKLADRASMFAALGDETRLSIVSKLCDGQPRSIAKLTSGSSVSRQAVTKHLRVLQDVGLVHNVRSGREALFQLVPEPIADLAQYLESVSQQWDDALSRLKSFLEKDETG